HAGAKIVANTNDAIRINADMPNGSLSIDNAGIIVSGNVDGAGNITGTKSGQALDLNAIVSASVQTKIINEAGGLICAADDDAIRPGVNATIENHGRIVAKNGGNDSNSDGIDFQDGGFGSVHNFTGGSIVGARHGITGKLPLTIDNDQGASITGQLGSGV